MYSRFGARSVSQIVRQISTDAGSPKVTADILKASALTFVPDHGWNDSLIEAARVHSLSDQATSMFSADDVIKFHYRQQLNRLQAYEPKESETFSRLRELIWYRLQGNETIGKNRLAEAIMLTLKTHPVTTTFDCLGPLVDELWFKAGDQSNDTTWYTRRGALVGVYGALEAFQSRDSSIGMRDTKTMMDKLVGALGNAEYMSASVSEWVGFNTRAVFNVMNTWR